MIDVLNSLMFINNVIVVYGNVLNEITTLVVALILNAGTEPRKPFLTHGCVLKYVLNLFFPDLNPEFL